MSIKVLVVVLVAIVVAVVLVLFYGAVRPAGDVGAAEDTVGSGLGWLVPTRALTIDDLGDECTDEATATVRVPAGSRCEFALPDRSEILLCTDDPAVIVVVDGEDYPAQELDAGDLGCEGAEPVQVYDVRSRLTIHCPALSPCSVRVLEPDG